jgi:hypothetical protein
MEIRRPRKTNYSNIYQHAKSSSEKEYLGIQKNCTQDLGVVHGLAQVVESVLLVIVRSMGKVEPGHVHAGLEQLLQNGHLPGLGSQSADDLGLGNFEPPIIFRVSQNVGNVYLGGHCLRPLLAF